MPHKALPSGSFYSRPSPSTAWAAILGAAYQGLRLVRAASPQGSSVSGWEAPSQQPRASGLLYWFQIPLDYMRENMNSGNRREQRNAKDKTIQKNPREGRALA